MDARRVLGVDARATPADIDAASKRLVRLVDPRRGGSAVLVALVRAARDALRRGDGRMLAPSIDPFELFELERDATVEAAKVAYRRLASRAHPDRGGTDELFRIVDGAYDALLRPASSAATGSSAWSPAAAARAAWPKREEWPRPRPERPYKAPPPDERFHAPGWRDWIVVVTSALLLLGFASIGVALVLISAATNDTRRALLVVAGPAWFVTLLVQGQTIGRNLLRALTRARAAYASQHGADPEAFLADRCLDSPVNREREDILYEAYAGWCSRRTARPVPRWVFIEKLRTLGLLHVQASAIEYGLFVGIRLRPEAAD